MATQLDNALAAAALSVRERRVVERLLARLRSELGPDLLAVWLYGSRARGEANVQETDPDRRSDIDLIVIVDPSRDANEFSWALTPLVIEAAEAEEDSPVWYSVLVYDAERCATAAGSAASSSRRSTATSSSFTGVPWRGTSSSEPALAGVHGLRSRAAERSP